MGLSRSSRFLGQFGSAGCVALAALLAGACGQSNEVGAPAPSERQQSVAASGPNWTWPDGVPGLRVTVDASLQRILETSAGIRADTVKRVIVAQGSEGVASELLAAADAQGRVCVTYRSVASEPFHCLDDLATDVALLFFVTDGGENLSVIGNATLVGLARSDVTRIVVETASGAASELSMNRWRSFSYVAESETALPRTLIAYDDQGNKLQEIGLPSSSPVP